MDNIINFIIENFWELLLILILVIKFKPYIGTSAILVRLLWGFHWWVYLIIVILAFCDEGLKSVNKQKPQSTNKRRIDPDYD